MEENTYTTLESKNVLVTVAKKEGTAFSIIYFDKRTSRSVTYKRFSLDEANRLAVELFDKEEMIY